MFQCSSTLDISLGGLHAVSSSLFGNIERGIGSSEEFMAIASELWAVGHARTDGDRTRHAGKMERFHRATEFLCGFQSVLTAGLGKEHGELLAAVSTYNVTFAHLLDHDRRHL